jgi:hypothetical protein
MKRELSLAEANKIKRTYICSANERINSKIRDETLGYTNGATCLHLPSEKIPQSVPIEFAAGHESVPLVTHRRYADQRRDVSPQQQMNSMNSVQICDRFQQYNFQQLDRYGNGLLQYNNTNHDQFAKLGCNKSLGRKSNHRRGNGVDLQRAVNSTTKSALNFPSPELALEINIQIIVFTVLFV